MTTTKVRCVVSGLNANGRPDFFGTVVDVDFEGYNNGEHYDIAVARAERAGFEEVNIVYDEKDGPAWLFDNMFGEAPVIDVRP